METLKKVEKVEVWGDRPYYVVEYINGKISFKMLSTSTLTEIIETLRQLNRMDKNAILIACCYEQYNGGSFNIEVNPDEQYKEIYKYGNLKYKTFMNKAIEGGITENRIPMSKEEVLNEYLETINSEIERMNKILTHEDDVEYIEYWKKRLNELETEREIVLKDINNLGK
jgi:hypothetical protein